MGTGRVFGYHRTTRPIQNPPPLSPLTPSAPPPLSPLPPPPPSPSPPLLPSSPPPPPPLSPLPLPSPPCPSPLPLPLSLPLVTDGEYTIKVRMTGQLDTPKTGPYALLLKNVSVSAATQITFGDVVTGTLAPEGDKDIYVFEWKAGQEAVVEASRGAGGLSAGFSPQVEIFDSKGNSLAKGSPSHDYDQPTIQVKPPLSQDGLYIIMVEGKLHVFWDIGNYTLSLKNLATP